jgi:hypothetical protein
MRIARQICGMSSALASWPRGIAPIKIDEKNSVVSGISVAR